MRSARLFGVAREPRAPAEGLPKLSSTGEDKARPCSIEDRNLAAETKAATAAKAEVTPSQGAALCMPVRVATADCNAAVMANRAP